MVISAYMYHIHNGEQSRDMLMQLHFAQLVHLPKCLAWLKNRLISSHECLTLRAPLLYAPKVLRFPVQLMQMQNTAESMRFDVQMMRLGSRLSCTCDWSRRPGW